jgi:predicted ATPase/DNA-binding SARP family transcriptional activator
MDQVRIGMLGPLEVYDSDGGAVQVPGARLRTLLIALALNPGRLVPTAQLIDAIWGDQPPATAGNSLQALVSRLRRALPDGLIESEPAGYRLLTDPDDIDVTRFERLVAAGRAEMSGDPVLAAATLREALALWRGPALLDVVDQLSFQAPSTRLEELRLTATEDWVEAELRLGRGAELVSELTTLTAEHPLRERLVGALMRALSQSGRPAEALAVYERIRAALADQLGADPSPELSGLHTAVLRRQIDAPRAPTVGASRRTNLRAGLTSFVGRDVDVARVRELTGEFRLTTLIGPGGSGKTRLAVEASRALLDQMPDGVWLVELAPVTEGGDLPSVVMAAMGLREHAMIDRGVADDPNGRLVAALRTRTVLLVLDNCEHVVRAAAALADRLLGECPRLRILATSREPLGITGEAVWRVEPLALPATNAELDAARLMSYDAVRLLVDRARAARPGFTFTDHEAPAVARICRALDGMPLAIELAAARLRTMSVMQLADGLADRFRLLTGGSRTAMRRHQTLRAAMDWSWELLSVPERALLRRLAIFTGGATQEAAEHVCVDDSVRSGDVLDLLTALTDKSLLVVTADDDGAPRYRTLETIRAYGLERLDEAGEREDVRRAYATYFVELTEAAEPHLRRAEQLMWLRRLRADHDNLNAALRGAIADGDAQTAVRFVAAAGWYWWLGGHKAEGIEMAIQALGVPGEVDDESRAEACAMVAYFTTAGLGDVRQAEPWIKQAQQLAEGVDHPGPLLRFVVTMFAVLQAEDWAGKAAKNVLQPLIDDEDPWVRAAARLSRTRMLAPDQREGDIEKAFAEFRTIGERWGISYALATLADLSARRGDLALALDYSQQAVVVITEIGAVEDLVLIRAKEAQLRWLIGDVTGAAAAMARAEREAADVGWLDAAAGVAFFKGDLARWAGDIATARAELAHSEALLGQTAPDPVFRAMILDSLAYLDAAEGDLDQAGARRAEALDIALGSRDEGVVCQVLVGAAEQAVLRDHPHEAARLLAASERAGGMPDRSRPDGARVGAAILEALGERDFSEAMRRARQEFAGARTNEPATAEAVRELAMRVLDA